MPAGNNRLPKCSPISFTKISNCTDMPRAGGMSEVYLTFDLDWVCNEVVADTLDLVELADVAATWFVTHDTPLISRIRANPKFELGIHPNFNFLIEGNPQNGKNAEEVVDRLLAIVPEAKVVRSHSMVQSSRLSQLFVDKGLTHECNHLIPEQANIALKPWRLWNGLIEVPHFWEDDAVCIYERNTPIVDLLARVGLKVFDFHPIHVFLNTECLDRYERTRPDHSNPAKLIKYRFPGPGTRSALEQLLCLA